MLVIISSTDKIITNNAIAKKSILFNKFKNEFGENEVESAYNLANQLITSAISSAVNDYVEDARVDFEMLANNKDSYYLKITKVADSTLDEFECVDIYLEDIVQSKKITVVVALLEEIREGKIKLSATIRSLQYIPNLELINEVIKIITMSDLERKRFYYYTTGEYALDDFANEHIVISRLGNVDDPNEWMANFTDNRESLSIDEIRDRIYKCLRPKFGFISVSDSPNIEPMWGLYADKYKGAVLELESEGRFVREVKYCKNRYKCDIKDFNWRFPKICYRKSDKWAFEKEYRMIFRLCLPCCTSTGLLRFAPLNISNPKRGRLFTLKRILCGPCMPEELFNRLRYQQWKMALKAKELGIKFDVKIVKMKLCQDTYDLTEGETFTGDNYP